MKYFYKTISLLLSYPEAHWVNEVNSLLAIHDKWPNELNETIEYIESNDLITLQENYVQLFDRTPVCSLHMFEHIHGEERTRGEALVNLQQEYLDAGLEPAINELPDYLPLFLEFLSITSEEVARGFLGDAVHVIAHIQQKLIELDSPYAVLFKLLVEHSPIEAKPFTTAPVRDMDDALEMFGTDHTGMEPLIDGSGCPYNADQQTIQFMQTRSHSDVALKG